MREHFKRDREKAEANEGNARAARSIPSARIDHDHEPLADDAVMDEMVDDLYRRTIRSTDRDAPNIPCNQSTSPCPDKVLDAAKSTLYDGSRFSVLRASLELLNLQTCHGWSNASVDALLRYTYTHVIHIYTCTHIHIYTNTHIHIHMSYTYTYTLIHIYTNIVYTYTYNNTHIHIHYTHIHILIHIYTN